MGANQVDALITVVGCLVATLIGYGVIPIAAASPLAERGRRILRVVGPLGVLVGIALFVYATLG